METHMSPASFDAKTAAAVNSAPRRARVAALCADPTTADFHNHAQTAKVSVNVDGQKLKANFTNKRLLSSFEHELDRVSGDAALAETSYVNAQGPYIHRRRTFESAFGRIDQMLYGVANTGNAGTLGRYGQFCVVVEIQALRADETYVIPCNSLEDSNRVNGYVELSNTLKVAELTNDIAHLGDLGHVVTEERASLCATVAPSEWPSVVCNREHSLVEVLMVSEPVTSMVEVRMRERYVDLLNRKDRQARRMGKNWAAQIRTVHELSGYRALVTSAKKVVTIP
jgi:hypothetical protein